MIKKSLLVLVAVIGFGFSINAQDFCDKIGNRIEFYPEEDMDKKVSFFNGGEVQLEVEGTFMLGKYKVQQSTSSSQDYLVIEFRDKGKTTLYGKYFRGVTTREGTVQRAAYIQILGVKLEKCKKK
ncbi:MAG: hypothetical protein LBN95_03670 [Prevotellaceae bacterium]|jgi:hypothetical protein|nr:hypothetical protein [Prevotellaceae bacterium]